MAVALGEEKHKLMAVVLHDEFGYTQVAIANLMKVAPSTISSWIAIGRLLIANRKLEYEVNQLKNELMSIGYNPVKPLDNEVFNIME